jgi:ferredoxin
MVKVKVTVDPERCELAGYCERIAETVFSLHNDDPPIRVDQQFISDPALIRLVLEAEATCPGRAILVEKIDE